MQPALRAGVVPAHPLLKPWYRLSTGESGVVLRFGGSVLTFEGLAAVQLMPHLVPLLDGTRTVDDIVAALGEPIRPAVVNVLELLSSHRLLIEPAGDPLSPGVQRTAELLAACSPAALTLDHLAAALAAAHIAIAGDGTIATTVAELLRESGVGRVDRVDWEDERSLACDLAVAAPAADEVDRLGPWNARALEAGTSWLQVLPFDGSLATVGPIFVPHESACHECYRRRRSANVSPVPDREHGRYPHAPGLDAILAGLATLVGVRWLAARSGGDVGELIAVELAPELATSRHVLFRVPRCPACSATARRAAPAPWYGAFDAAA